MAENSSTPAPGTADSGMAAAEKAFAKLLTGEESGNQKQSEAQDEPEAVAADDESLDEPEAVEADDESDPGDDEEQDDEAPEVPIYTVKVDGQEIQVPIDELLNGYSRTQDYTRKTQKLAEERKAAQAEFEAVRAERAQYAQYLEVLRQQLEAGQPAEPDWDRLRAEDPIEYGVQWAEHQRRQQKMAAVRAQQAQLAQVQQAEQVQAMRGMLEKEKQALLHVLPEWKDPAKARAEKAELIAFGKQNGFTDEELNTITDHRAVVALRKAMLYDKLMTRRTQVKPVSKPAMPVLKPGSAETAPRKASELTRAKQRLAKTGRTADAADAFYALLTTKG